MMSSVVPVVLSGGAGTRLWPLSRPGQPKQFQSLIGSESMLTQTLSRVAEFREQAMVVVSAAHVEALAALAEGVHIVAEPEGRNTAPAVAAAALLSDPDDILLVMPADHHIGRPADFQATLSKAVAAARGGFLTTFGVVPDRPATGFGYIVPTPGEQNPSRIDRFVEKPDEATAAALIDQGALWNSGMFVFPVAILLEELDRLQPHLMAAVRGAVRSASDHPWGIALGSEFSRAPSIAIDVAVMEQTSRAAVVLLAAEWSDVGSWATLWDLGEKDESRNVIEGPVTVLDSARNYLRSEGPRVAVSGVENLIIVATPTSVLVTSRAKAQTVKDLFELLDPEDR